MPLSLFPFADSQEVSPKDMIQMLHPVLLIKQSLCMCESFLNNPKLVKQTCLWQGYAA